MNLQDVFKKIELALTPELLSRLKWRPLRRSLPN